LEKLESHEEVTVKALLDSGITGLFMDTKFAKEKGFKLEKSSVSTKCRWDCKCRRSNHPSGRVQYVLQGTY